MFGCRVRVERALVCPGFAEHEVACVGFGREEVIGNVALLGAREFNEFCSRCNELAAAAAVFKTGKSVKTYHVVELMCE